VNVSIPDAMISGRRPDRIGLGPLTSRVSAMKQCHTKGSENSRELCALPPLLGERAGVRASVFPNLVFRLELSSATGTAGGAQSSSSARYGHIAIALIWSSALQTAQASARTIVSLMLNFGAAPHDRERATD